MATGDSANQMPSTDDQDTADFGATPVAPSGALLKDRYLLIRQLNEGGFGTVHLAHDQQMHGRPVVVKIQINQSVDDPWFERKFNEEVRALSMIDHPGVIVAIDSGRTPDGKPFLVMQYVDGVTLRAVMNPEGMPLDRVAGILQQVGHALGAAHEKGVWHRDLKPENLMLQTLGGPGERVRLIDFGIATVADLRNKYQNTTRVAGSFLYMAPEQALGQASAATDIYAMGLIAYEMVTGRKPFIAENTIQLAALQRQGVRVKPSDLRPSLPAKAEQLILQSLEFDPLKRPRGARDFGDRLSEALLDSEATRMTVQTAKPSAGLRKAWLAGSVLAVAAVLAGVAYLTRDKPDVQKVVVKEVTPKPQAPATIPDPAAEQAIELAFWNSVKDSTEPQLYREYLSKYPRGRFASLADVKLSILARKSPPKTDTAVKASNQAREDEVELTFWNSVKDATDQQLYRDYLEKYPRGRFESLARTKLEILARRRQGGPPRGSRGDSSAGQGQDLRTLSLIDPKMAAELADWIALKDVKDPQAFRDFLGKYPKGRFASIAKLKAEGFSARDVRPGTFPFEIPVPPEPPDLDAERERHSLPPPRAALDVDSYSGARQGELHWSGSISKHGAVAIQGGKASSGSLTGDLPRVPVTVQIVTVGVVPAEPPAPHNHWDRLILRNISGAAMAEIVIRWQVVK
jgi:tRNA A-37 threonylcarbamoyl transferase component Bud32